MGMRWGSFPTGIVLVTFRLPCTWQIEEWWKVKTYKEVFSKWILLLLLLLLRLERGHRPSWWIEEGVVGHVGTGSLSVGRNHRPR